MTAVLSTTSVIRQNPTHNPTQLNTIMVMAIKNQWKPLILSCHQPNPQHDYCSWVAKSCSARAQASLNSKNRWKTTSDVHTSCSGSRQHRIMQSELLLGNQCCFFFSQHQQSVFQTTTFRPGCREMCLSNAHRSCDLHAKTSKYVLMLLALDTLILPTNKTKK